MVIEITCQIELIVNFTFMNLSILAASKASASFITAGFVFRFVVIFFFLVCFLSSSGLGLLTRTSGSDAAVSGSGSVPADSDPLRLSDW